MKKTLIIMLISLLAFSAKAQKKELPPEGGTPRDFNLPEKEVVTLNNGLRLVMIPYGQVPKATINIVVKTGSIHESEDKVWLSNLMFNLMEEGTTTQTSQEIADKVAGMGGNLSVAAGTHISTVSSSVIYEFVPDAITLMADILMNPKWPDSEIDRLKNDMKRNLSVTLSRPRSLASQDFFATIYPDHPYGNRYSTDEMIESFTMQDVKDFYTNNVGAQRTTVYVAGKFNKKTVKETIEAAFAQWTKGPADYYPQATPVTGSSVQLIDRPGALQSTIYYGLPVADPSNKDYIPLSLANSMLGGSFSSRITSNIREDKGYTYSPFSTVRTNYKSAVWYESADVTTDVTGPSLQEINKEILQLRNEAPSADELRGIQNYQSGIFVLRNSSRDGLIGELIFLDIHDLDDSHLTDQVKNIYAVTPEQIQQMVLKYIRPEDMTLVIVGDKKKIEKQIKDYEKDIRKY